MTNLIPTPIVDKNGVSSTRLKKADAAGSAAKSKALAKAKPTVKAKKEPTAAQLEQRAERDAKVKRLLGEIEMGVEELMTGENWQRHLEVMGKLHNYSFNNQLLIKSQMPDATKVSSYTNWTALKRQVRKGEKGITILAPMFVKKEEERGGEMKEIRIPVGFKTTTCFDVSQTDGEEMPEDPIQRLDGDAPFGMKEDLAAFLVEAGTTVEYRDMGAEGKTTTVGGKVVVNSAHSPAQQALAMAYELGRHKMGHFDKESKGGQQSLTDKAIEAESFAYVVSRAKGLNAAGDYSFGNVSTWAAKDGDKEGEAVKRVQSHGKRISDAVKDVLTKKWEHTES